MEQPPPSCFVTAVKLNVVVSRRKTWEIKPHVWKWSDAAASGNHVFRKRESRLIVFNPPSSPMFGNADGAFVFLTKFCLLHSANVRIRADYRNTWIKSAFL